MIERTFDAAFFNDICNRPEVRPGLGGTGEIDVSAIVQRPENYALRAEFGGFILQAHGAGFYSVHTQFAAEGRGQSAVAAMRDGLDFMFTRTDCMRISSICPDNNPATLAFARAGGARPWFRKEHDPLFGPSQVVSWDIFDWATRTEALGAEGQAFHDLLEAAKLGTCSLLAVHDDDPVHDRVVGAAMLMCKRGQPQKGVLTYNLWAMAAGYMPVSLMSAEPPVVDVVDAVVGLDPQGELEVLTCR